MKFGRFESVSQYPHFKHQLEYLENHGAKRAWGLLWEQGCYDKETEFLTPSGWVKFPDYEKGMLVAQWSPEDRSAEFVNPLGFMSKDNDEWILLSGRGLNQKVSLEHRLPVLRPLSLEGEQRAIDMLEDFQKGGEKTRRYLPSSYVLSLPGSGIPLSDENLRVMIMVMADGSFPSKAPFTKRVTVRVKKERKKQRAREILAHMPYEERESGEYSLFVFVAPLRIKEYPREWWTQVSDRQREIILDEVWRWDGSAARGGKGPRFFSTSQASLDFVQFMFSSAGHVSSIVYDNKPNAVGTVLVRGTRTEQLCLYRQNVTRVSSPEKMYCFTVPSSWLVIRRHGVIGISGNTAKTKPTIETAMSLYDAGEINGLLVVAPPGVERNWRTDELPKHSDPDFALENQVAVFDSNKKHTKAHKTKIEALMRAPGMATMLISYDAFMTKDGKAAVAKFLRRRRCLYVLDEAHNIKSPGAKRTISIVASGKYAPYRRILTGTPMSVGPMDLYSQIRFLDEDFWRSKGIGGYTEFKRYFGVWFTKQDCLDLHGYDPGYDKLIEYRNLDILAQWLPEIAQRIEKSDVLDLPPKLYSKRYHDLSKEQQTVYDELKSEFMYQFEDGALVDGELAIVRLLRLQQILCNYVPTDGEPSRQLSSKNPRLELMEEIRDETYHPAIVWARFRSDVDQLMDLLGKEAVRYDGAVTQDEAERSKLAFQAGDAKWFIGTAQKGGSGLTLVQAKSVIYYSNSFKLIDRLQSEDRAHRPGMDEHPVSVIDLCCSGTVDERIIRSLREKREVSAEVLGDEIREWI